jgi:hypothetical protein
MRPAHGGEKNDGTLFAVILLDDEAGERAFSSRMRPDNTAMARPGATPRTPTAPHSLNATPPQTWEDQVTVFDPASQLIDSSMNE